MLPFMIWMAIGVVSSLGVLAVLMRTQEYITLEDVAALGVLSFLGPLPTAILGYLLWDTISCYLPKGDWRYIVVWSKEKKEKGFTLIEFLIIAALLGIVAAVAIPMYSDYLTVKKDRERGIDTETVDYKEWMMTRTMGTEYQVPSRKKSRTKCSGDDSGEDMSPSNTWTHPETGFTCDLKELNCNVLREQYMGRKKNE